MAADSYRYDLEQSLRIMAPKLGNRYSKKTV